jgi:hypothetical protein
MQGIISVTILEQGHLVENEFALTVKHSWLYTKLIERSSH